MSSDTEPHASELLSGLFTAQVLAFETRGPVDVSSLHPLEARHVSRSAPKRVKDFAAGRACVRAALAQLSIRDFAVRSGADREPLWPPGVTGSITHTGEFCGAVLARSSEVLALGIDAESRDAVHPHLWRQIATEQERHWLETLPAEDAIVMATVLFSAKESFFKCQFPLTHEWVGFHDVSVSIEPPGFEVHPGRPLKLQAWAPAPWAGRYSITADLVATGLALSVPESASGPRG